MKAVLYNKKNQKPNRLIYCDIEKPEPLDDQVLIKICSVSLNASDYRAMNMGFIPNNGIFGADISGIIEAVGSAVTGFSIGESVIGCLQHYGSGGLAEYVAVSEKAIIKKPEHISYEDASTIPVAGVTAIYALRNKGQIKKGDRVLIVGSSGSVGTFAVQLAKYFGAEVTGVCSTNNIEQTKILGADYVIDYTEDKFLNQGKYYDIILGINGNYPILSYYKSLTKNGKFIMVGGGIPQILKSIFLGWTLSFGRKKIMFSAAWELNDDIKLLAQLIEKNIIKPVINRRYTLEQAPEAMMFGSQGHSSGKIVINITEQS